MNEFTEQYLTNIIENHFKQIDDSLSHNQPERADLWMREAKPYIDFHKEHSEDVFKAHQFSETYKIYQEWYLKLIPYK